MQIYRQRLTRAQEALCAQDIDAWITLGRENGLLREPALLFLLPVDLIFRYAIVVTRAGERISVVSRIEAEEMQDSGLFTRVLVHNQERSFEQCLTEALESCMPMAKLAINSCAAEASSDGLTHSNYLLLTKCLAQAGFAGELVSSAPILKQIRGRKSDEEVAGIARAVSAAMGVYEQARPHMRMGMSGMDVQRLFKEIIAEKRYGYSWHEKGNPFVSVGTRSSYLCKTPPSDVYIQPGDVVNVDLGIRLDGYASDNQRTFYASRPGESAPPEEVRRAFDALQRMNAAVCAAMRPGVRSAALTDVGNRVMLDCGYEAGWKGSYGHEIGLFAHNGGISSGRGTQADLDDTLEPNMTFTLEPALLTSHGRVCQEEVVCVKDGGGQMLSTPQTEIWLI